MLWNELDYDTQLKVIKKMEMLVKYEKNLLMKQAFGAALNELECWSNSPCDEPVPPPTTDFSPFVIAQALDQDIAQAIDIDQDIDQISY